MHAEGIPLGYWYNTPMYRSAFLSSNLFGCDNIYNDVHCAETEKICQTGLALSQSVLLGNEEDIEDIIKAVAKIRRNVGKIIENNS